MASNGDEERIGLLPNATENCYSGRTCIENRFYTNSGKNNWGGFYFMNGILEEGRTDPIQNWGDWPDAGINLTGATELTFWARGASGSERVEFFACGIGYNPNNQIPNTKYPDSSRKISTGYLVLSKEWEQYSIDLQGYDLSYVLGGFGWVTSSGENDGKDIIFYLDDIQYDKSRLNEPRFLVSYDTIRSSIDFDVVNQNFAYTYDNALVLIAYLSRGTPNDIERAGLLADAMITAVYNDRDFSDGRIRNTYQGGDLTVFPGWGPKNEGEKQQIRTPGWWNSSANKWFEDEFAVSTHTGNVAWTIIALISYYEVVGESKYLTAALKLGEWIETNTKSESCDFGYTGGYVGWEANINNITGQKKITWKATEHNIDIFVAFNRIYQVTKDTVWKDRALHAKYFVKAMWDDLEGHFWTGTLDNGETINKENIPADVNTWGLMALGDTEKYGIGINWVGNNCYVSKDGFQGFDFNMDQDHIWWEGTAHMTIAYQILGEKTKNSTFLSEFEKVQNSSSNNNGKGIVAANIDGLTTGFDWLYYNRLHIGATAWYIFAVQGYNPYWGIHTTDLIPIYEIDPIEVTYTHKDFNLTNVCTEENNYCKWANRPGKAVIYGEMDKSNITVPKYYKNLEIIIYICNNGYGEGLSGPSGSSAHIIVDNMTRIEAIDSTMKYHHGGYFRYEVGESFTNSFVIKGKITITLTIRMNLGAHLDFQKVILKFT